MSLAVDTGSALAAVKVIATQHRGHTPEELADLCLSKLISVGEQVDPVLRDQALAYRERIRALLIATCAQAQRSERTTMCVQLEEAGMKEAAALIRST